MYIQKLLERIPRLRGEKKSIRYNAKSLAIHPGSTTHAQLSTEQQLAAGVKSELIRLSIGIEHINDILADLDQVLEAAGA